MVLIVVVNAPVDIFKSSERNIAGGGYKISNKLKAKGENTMTIKNSSGFTSVEVIIVAIMLFVICAIMAPPLFQRIKKKEEIVVQIAKGKMLSKKDYAFYMQFKGFIDRSVYIIKNKQEAEQRLNEAYRNYQDSLQK